MKYSFKIFWKFFAFALTALTIVNSYAQNAEECFKLANSSYKKGDYKTALEYYQNAKKQGANSAELFFNMANAYAKCGDNSLAQLNYLKAISVNPRMSEAQANLDKLSNDFNFTIPQKNVAKSVLGELSEGEWSIIALASFWCVILLVVLPPLYGKRNAAIIFLSIVAAVVFCAAIAGIFNWKEFKSRAVAVGENPALRISPAPNAPIDSILADGQIATILKRRGNFLYLESANGKRGWGNIEQFQAIQE